MLFSTSQFMASQNFSIIINVHSTGDILLCEEKNECQGWPQQNAQLSALTYINALAVHKGFSDLYFQHYCID